MALSPQSFKVNSSQRGELIDITRQINTELDASQMRHGAVHVFVPHTTAGVTINENADPDVRADMLAQLDVMVLWQQEFFKHQEGNSAAHVKASLVGSSVLIPVRAGRLLLGQWQGVYLCEFDGPREREVHVTYLGSTNND